MVSFYGDKESYFESPWLSELPPTAIGVGTTGFLALAV
jgi:hypothetical protein